MAEAAGVTRVAIHEVITRARPPGAAIRWRGADLRVEVCHGRGGAAGKRYRIQVASLPPEVQAALQPAVSPPPRMPVIRANDHTGDWRMDVAARLAAHGAPGSPERARAVQDAAHLITFREGKRAGQLVGERTLRGWIAAYEKRGRIAPLKLARADRGKARVVAWRAWDRAMDAAGIPKARQQEVAAELRNLVRGMWGHGAPSAFTIRTFMQDLCWDVAVREGLALQPKDRKALCRPPSNFVMAKELRRARHAHTKRADAAGYAANLVPRIRRHRNGLRPMQLVAADVRHSDVLYRREDGSLATPKMVAFADLATNRVFARTFLLPKGEMVRREHVLLTLRDMMADLCWGVPHALYLDNGSEFKIGLAADDLARLAQLIRDAGAFDFTIETPGEAPSSAGPAGTVKSRPYNPQSKVIEGIFSIFTRSIEPMTEGFIGGNRMAKKVENQGRAPVPLPGDASAVLTRFDQNVAYYNAREQQKGHIARRSPQEAFGEFVRDGWQAVVLKPGEFELAFGKDARRVVQPGGELHIARRIYRHDMLAPMVGERVSIRIPILGEPLRVVVLTDKGEPMCVAQEDRPFAMRDLAGVRESDRRRRDLGERIKAEVQTAAPANFASRIARQIASVPGVPAPAPLAAASVHPVLREAADAAEADVEATLPAPSEKRRRMNEQFAAARAFLAGTSRAG